jgi:N-acetyl sugar amidotransferase|tara:strand:- start:2966 stop:4144 length:1179 start_codon:yes stop_codon:yes gene_type:complete
MSKQIPEQFKNLKISDPNKEVIYCKKCVMSNQRPRVEFNSDGVCGQCLYSEYKNENIDWKKREKELERLCEKYRKNDGSHDVIVPGSGGKDSSYVAYILKEKYGMNPLTLTWAPTVTTDIGRKNLQDFIDSGYDNMYISPNGKNNQKISKIAFEEFGDHFMPFIYGQYHYSLVLASKYNIPFIMFGENGELEYGGSLKKFDTPTMDITKQDYILEKFSNFPPEYWTKHGLKMSDLKMYLPPTIDEIKISGVEKHYFSYYQNWKPEKHYEVVKQHLGFQPDTKRSEGTYTNFASLDDKTDGFHYYLMFIKFGIGRTTSDAAHQIRDGIITRDEGVDLVHKYDGEFPSRYLDTFLEYMKIDRNRFDEILDKFRKDTVWKKVGSEWKLRQQVQKN